MQADRLRGVARRAEHLGAMARRGERERRRDSRSSGKAAGGRPARTIAHRTPQGAARTKPPATGTHPKARTASYERLRCDRSRRVLGARSRATLAMRGSDTAAAGPGRARRAAGMSSLDVSRSDKGKAAGPHGRREERPYSTGAGSHAIVNRTTHRRQACDTSCQARHDAIDARRLGGRAQCRSRRNRPRELCRAAAVGAALIGRRGEAHRRGAPWLLDLRAVEVLGVTAARTPRGDIGTTGASKSTSASGGCSLALQSILYEEDAFAGETGKAALEWRSRSAGVQESVERSIPGRAPRTQSECEAQCHRVAASASRSRLIGVSQAVALAAYQLHGPRASS